MNVRFLNLDNFTVAFHCKLIMASSDEQLWELIAVPKNWLPGKDEYKSSSYSSILPSRNPDFHRDSLQAIPDKNRFAVIYYLRKPHTSSISSSTSSVTMQPTFPLVLVASLLAIANAVPTGTGAGAPSILEKRSCDSKLHCWQADGGCSADWRRKCPNACKGSGQDEGCRQGTTSWNINGSGCFWGWSTCECTCPKK